MSLANLNRQIREKQWPAAVASLFALLNDFEQLHDVDTQYLANRFESHSTAAFTQIADAITALLTAESFQINRQQFEALCLHQSKIIAIFALSSHRDTTRLTEHFVKALKRCKKLTHKDYPNLLMKCLLTYDLQLSIDLPWQRLANVHYAIMLMTCLSLLAQKNISNKQGEQQLASLMTAILNTKPREVGEHYLPVIGRAWYNLSYYAGEQPKAMVKYLNALIQIWVKKHSIPINNRKSISRDKPLLIIPLENFTSTHAAYRCLAPAIKQLQTAYYLLAIATPQAIDEISASLFDEVKTCSFEVPSDVFKLIADIEQLQPDMMFYPTLGMQYWSIILANCRLAPIQCLSPSQAASSHSPHIDYLLIHDEFYDAKATSSEHAVRLSPGSYHFAHPSNEVVIERDIEKINQPLTILVAGTYYKINDNFLQLCENITHSTRKPIQFVFTIHQQALMYRYNKLQLQQRLPGSIVYPTLPYASYLDLFTQADMMLVTFPFGGTNSSIDALRAALPFIALEGVEPFAKVEAELIKRLDLPVECLAQTPDEYLQKAIMLINDDQRRLEHAQILKDRQRDLEGLFTDEQTQMVYKDVLNQLLTEKDL